MEMKCYYWLDKYVKQINTILYDDYRINYYYFHHDSLFQGASDMRVLCESLF